MSEEFLYQTIAPSPPLDAFVKCFWVLESPVSTGEETIVTDGCPELIFHYGDHFAEMNGNGEWIRQPQAIVAGQITRPLNLLATGAVGMFGVRFWPHGLYPILGVSLDELTNARVEASRFPFLRDLLCQLQRATDMSERIRVCEGRLLELCQGLTEHVCVSLAVQVILQSHGTVGVRELAKKLNTTERRLQRQFKLQVGLSPRHLCRAIRFHNIFERLQEPPHPRWTELAIDCGFFDQAHLNRDFRQFAGQSPSAYFANETPIAERLSGST